MPCGYSRLLVLALAALAPFGAQDTTGAGGLVGKLTGQDRQPTPQARDCLAPTERCAAAAADRSFAIPDTEAQALRTKG